MFDWCLVSMFVLAVTVIHWSCWTVLSDHATSERIPWLGSGLSLNLCKYHAAACSAYKEETTFRVQACVVWGWRLLSSAPTAHSGWELLSGSATGSFGRVSTRSNKVNIANVAPIQKGSLPSLISSIHSWILEKMVVMWSCLQFFFNYRRKGHSKHGTVHLHFFCALSHQWIFEFCCSPCSLGGFLSCGFGSLKQKSQSKAVFRRQKSSQIAP